MARAAAAGSGAGDAGRAAGWGRVGQVGVEDAGQDRRADLPVIGLGTPDAVSAAGLSGIVIEAGGVMVLDRARTVARCDQLGLFLWVREKGG